MAKLNAWTGRREGTALADDLAVDDPLVDDDDAFLRPSALASPQRKKKPASRVDPADDAERFLRARRRVPPKKGVRWRALLRTRFGRVVLAAGLLCLIAALATAIWQVRQFLLHDPHFRIDSSASIESSGITELSRAELLKVFGSDIGRNVFFVPLAQRVATLEAEPWVRHATVMRLLPNVLRVAIVERVPVAFARVGRGIQLVDSDGVLLPMAPATLAARHYSFPVVTGLDPNGSSESRAERMRLFNRFLSAMNADGGNVSAQLSEVDLSDLDDVRAVVPAQGTDILLHFGNSDFLARYRSYQEHLAEWRQQYPNLSAVDLRYDQQVVLKMADAAAADEAAEAKPLATPAAKAATPAAKALGFHGAQAAAHPTMHPTTHPSPHAAAQHRSDPAASSTIARHTGKPVWYTRSQAKPHHPAKWVPHYIPNAGRAQ